MRPTLPVLQAWSVAGLSAAATQLRAASEQMESIAHDASTRVDLVAPTWTGAAAQAARAAAAAERTTILRTADLWSGASRDVTSAADQIGDLRSRVLHLVEAAHGEGLRVDATGRVSIGRSGTDLVGWVRALALVPVYALQINSILDAVDHADRSAATALASAGGDTVDATTLLAAAPTALGDPDLTEPGPDGFRIGDPDRPHIEWDEDYEWGSESATADDVAAAARWRAKMAGARFLRWDLGDALDAYSHYWSNSGDTFTIDYERAYRDDTGIQANVDAELARAIAGADRIASSGSTSFSMTGAASATGTYPVTENWQKTVGGYQQWSSADVTVDGTTVTMDVTVHAEDYYNFNRGQADIASGAPDDENGRFTEIGWAKPFPTTGTVTRTITWELGDTSAPTTTAPDEGR